MDEQRQRIHNWMTALLEPKQVVEVRTVGPVSTRVFATAATGEFDKLTDYVCRMSGSHKGVYFTPNPMATTTGTGYHGAAKDENIAKRIWLLVDIDSVRPKDTNATEVEVKAALMVAKSIKATLEARGFTGIVLGSSGNGAHLMVPVELPNDDTSRSMAKNFLIVLQERFGRTDAVVDCSTHNASRIWKMPGTLTMKGESTTERPHRFAELIDVPTDARTHAAANVQLLIKLIADWRVPEVKSSPDRYAKSALEKECGAVVATAESNRNNRLNEAAFNLGQLVAGGMLERTTVEGALLHAARGCGLGDDESMPVIQRGLEAGNKSPRSLPAPSTNGVHKPTPKMPDGDVLIPASSITPRKVEWLWPDRIPIGKMTTFAGLGGLGKTFALLDIAARVSRGSEWPFADGECAKQGRTIFITGEDDPDDTLVPRLIEMGADLSQVFFMVDQHIDVFCLRDLELLNRAIAQSGPTTRFVAIDPPTAFLGDTNDNSNAELRGLLSPLKSWAAKHRVALVFNTHLNKGSGNVDAMMRVMGSVAWVNAVRVAHIFARDPDDSERRIFACMKRNIGKETKALAYRLAVTEMLARIEWLETVETTADEAVGRPRDKPRRIIATEWLIEKFREKLEWMSDDLFRAGKEEGVSRSAIFEAKKSPALEGMKVRKTVSVAGDTAWAWYVPFGWPPIRESQNNGESESF